MVVLLCPQHGRKDKGALCSLFYKSFHSVHEVSAPMTKPPPEGSAPDTSCRGLGLQHTSLGRHTNTQSVAREISDREQNSHHDGNIHRRFMGVKSQCGMMKRSGGGWWRRLHGNTNILNASESYVWNGQVYIMWILSQWEVKRQSRNGGASLSLLSRDLAHLSAGSSG